MNSLKLAETIQISIKIKRQKLNWMIKIRKSTKVMDQLEKYHSKIVEKQEIRQIESDKKREE